MTLRFQFSYFKDGAEPMDISITRDGEVTFNDRDMEYETAFAAMGGKETAAMEFLARWPTRRWRFIHGMMSDLLSENRVEILWWFLADCIEHVLPYYRNQNPHDERVWDAIVAIRSYRTNYGVDRLGLPQAEVFGAWQESTFGSPQAQVALAAYNAIELLGDRHVVGHPYRMIDRIGSLIEDCCIVMVDSTQNTNEEPCEESDIEAVIEAAWQWRRFYDILKAVRAGEKWPLMEATP